MIGFLMPLTALDLMAFTLFALSNFATFRDITGQAPGKYTGNRLKISAFALLGGALWLSLSQYTPGLGLLLWFGNMTMTALLVALSLSLRETFNRPKRPRRNL
ncbi:DUF3325 domain-containing protein [Shewanella sp. GXUN23E]|uniref:DUF3325 domain-containing protein n=1 Tax=Shewanella sp. GXUN23E TaxID=3422498 RepID=UPI003D7F0FDE